MKHLHTFAEFLNESLNESLNENVGGLLPKDDYPIYIAIRTDKIDDDYMAAAVLPDGTAINNKYQPMSYVLEELRKHYGMSKGQFPSNKTSFDRYGMKKMDVAGTSIKLNWGPQNKGYQLINMYGPDRKELETITELIAKFATK